MNHSPKVLFIGFDATDKDLVLKWAGEGLLPATKSLMDRSAWGLTINPPAFYVGAVWPSFCTSLSPMKHGRYCFKQIQENSYEPFQFLPAHLKGEAFWLSLSRQGKRVAVIDIPKSSLSNQINGLQVVDWTVHDPDEGFRAWPEQMAETIEKEYGLDPVGVCDGVRRTAQDFDLLRQKLIARAKQKTDYTLAQLKREPWDCFMTAFSEGHCAGHQFWHIHDTTHPRHLPELAAALGNPILEIYQAMDKGLAEILKAVDSKTTVVALFSHGMGPHYEATYMFDEILRRLEIAGTPKSKNWKDSARKIWHLVPKSIRQHLFKKLKKQINKDVSGRKYFQSPNNDPFGAIRFNVVGREPQGILNPGEELEKAKSELIRDLMALTNAETGKPAVLRVHRIEELYPNSDTHLFPDLLVEWNREAPIVVVESPKLGRVVGTYEGCRSGDHKQAGLFMACGPGVKKGRLERAVSVMDFAPTIAELLGARLDGVDGQSFRNEIF